MLFKNEEHLPMSERQELPRLTLMQRIQHILIFSSLLTLVATAFPIKFADAPWALHVMDCLGGPPVTRIIHRVAGVVFFGTFIFHVFYLAFNFIVHSMQPENETLWDKLKFFSMVPDKKDGLDLIQDIKYWLFISDHKAPKRKFDYFGKFGYMAVFWGIPIVGPSGVIMWFKEFFFEVQIPLVGQLPPEAFSIAKMMHSDEVFLATIVLTVWHWYPVHYNPDVFPLRWTWLNGTIPAFLLEEEHLLEYERLIEEDEKARAEKANDHTGGYDV